MFMADQIGMLFFKEKQAKLLLALASSPKEWYISDLAKTTNVTYIHTSRFISRCEESGIVKVERHGKVKGLTLTDKGVEIASTIQNLIEKLNKKENPEQAKI
jgi:DNA-binding MarR family transcriptional regulator